MNIQCSQDETIKELGSRFKIYSSISQNVISDRRCLRDLPSRSQVIKDEKKRMTVRLNY